MSGTPQQFVQLQKRVMDGFAAVDSSLWQPWIEHSETNTVIQRVGELGPDRMLKLLQGALVHELFTPIEPQIARWREWLPELSANQDITVDLGEFVNECKPPQWPDDCLTAVVLVLRGHSAAKEFELYWPLIARQQHAHWKYDKLVFDDQHIRWLKGSENETKDWRFEWQTINLGANRNTSSETVRSRTEGPLPNVGILAAAALHDEWVRQMNGGDIRYVDLLGYECTVPGFVPWQFVPILKFNRVDRKVGLDAIRCDFALPGWGVPCFAE